jgi:hypothetical protein
MKIEKKIWPKYFKDIKSGKKNFELRLADFKCKPSDVLILREWDQKKKKYTGRILEKKVAYVLRTKDLTFWAKKDIEECGFQIIALK